MDLYNRTWECIARDDEYVCPGYFNTYCQEGLSVECGCAGEVWMSPDCREVRSALSRRGKRSESALNFSSKFATNKRAGSRVRLSLATRDRSSRWTSAKKSLTSAWTKPWVRLLSPDDFEK